MGSGSSSPRSAAARVHCSRTAPASRSASRSSSGASTLSPCRLVPARQARPITPAAMTPTGTANIPKATRPSRSGDRHTASKTHAVTTAITTAVTISNWPSTVRPMASSLPDKRLSSPPWQCPATPVFPRCTASCGASETMAGMIPTPASCCSASESIRRADHLATISRCLRTGNKWIFQFSFHVPQT